MVDEARLSGLIGLAYEASRHPEGWPAFLGQLADTLDAKSALLRTVDLSGPRQVLATHHFNLDDRLQADYRAQRVNEDPYLDALQRFPTGTMVRNDNLIDLARLQRTAFYTHYMKPLDNHYIVGGYVEQDNEGRHTLMGLHRHHRACHFSDAERAFVQTLTPHVRRALSIQRAWQRDRARAATAEDVLDSLGIAALALTAHGQLIHANAGAWDILRDRRSLLLRAGRIYPSDARLRGPFQAALQQAATQRRERVKPPGTSCLLPARGERPRQALLAIAIPTSTAHDACGDDHAVTLYLGELDETGSPRPETLQHLYALTPTQARVAAALAQGDDLATLSERWQLSTETLRTHLKSVFAKTGVNRQSELVRLLSGAIWRIDQPH